MQIRKDRISGCQWLGVEVGNRMRIDNYGYWGDEKALKLVKVMFV